MRLFQSVPILIALLMTSHASAKNLCSDIFEKTYKIELSGTTKLENFLNTINLDINGRDAMGRTPLMLAIRQGNLSFIKPLLRMGANPNARDIYGNTPLHYAVQYNAVAHPSESTSTNSAIERLIEHNADTQLVNKRNETALGLRDKIFAADENYAIKEFADLLERQEKEEFEQAKREAISLSVELQIRDQEQRRGSQDIDTFITEQENKTSIPKNSGQIIFQEPKQKTLN